MQTLKAINGKWLPVEVEDDENCEVIEIPKEQQIMELKQQLAQTDYKAIKYAEGWISEADYAPIKAERKTIREEINRLESEINEYTEETDTV
ncbi:MAG: hypothetical protein Q4E99_05180 [Bacillota bacterium]|nr:hypothetical protein [Bacillota bacterium]